ncbi:MAG TPA: FKBP-type peptidyl-prolyl cis-trans isomerase [Candidatus Sulfotelmatobacter sp.]|nr:FKBP-type peptidyl-prolyl cis-trans isomerase [Candidatus Sulfotelmatobacter sp.]
MPKIQTLVLPLMAGMLLLSEVSAQQSTAGQSSKPASTQSSASGAKTTPKKPATAAKSASPAITLKTKKDKDSYALGMSIGTGLHRQGVPVDPAMVARGLRDAMMGGKTLITEDEMKSTLQALRTEVGKEQAAKAHAAGEANRKESDTFLTANKAKEGVTTLPDGLQYKVLQEGSGPKPTLNDTVTVNYRGTLVDGKEFDSSYKRGQPATFPVGGVIKGWTEALQLMPVGSKWQLFIPADLAYGDNPPDPSIRPGDALIFEVELLSIGQKR